ncbi:MAG: ATP-binding protein [Gammaproteobacteria bacterium]|nr:ATP-binding protein [Gammaproteobacteria bacterium]
MTLSNIIAILLKSLALDLGGESNSPRQGLQRLLLLRTFVTVAGVIGLLIFLSFRELNIPIRFIIYLVLVIFTSIFAGYWRLKASRLVSYGELFSHILLDVAFLIILLLNTGGIGNPLISYLLVLLAVSATLLPRAFVNTFAVGSILLYTFFLFLELTADAEMGNGETTFQLHLMGMWVIFLVSAILISVFITRMASAIQVRELNLAEARETEMRNEQLVAIGTLAAGTAHALGTPLSTMAVLLTELDKLSPEELKDNDIKDDISILKQQVTRCKHSLTQLTRYYNKDSAEKEETQLLPKFVNDIQDYIINIHPTASVRFLIENAKDLKVASSLSIRHALINIIENGIKASKTHVEVKFKITQAATTYFEVAVKDDGPGIPTKIMENMGEPFISIRKENMGLGIFLANAAVQRLDGSIEMFNLKSGGALTLIKLPMPDSRSL